ncbi:hypothetical protein [Streptomyces sp. NPDC057363]|uniref:hypothetical protein n=1 Tax=Streptomyces sp. NPDC057363 TaxID=3346107 RepID=UPI003635EE24
MLQDTLGEPEWAELLTPVDRRGPTPLFWFYVRPCRKVNLGMGARLNCTAVTVPRTRTSTEGDLLTKPGTTTARVWWSDVEKGAWYGACQGGSDLSGERTRMLSEAMTALAAAGGTAVVQAASTDAWAGLRQRLARWLGRGNPQRENAELERLDQTAGELNIAGPAELERVRIRQGAAWQARIETLLESLDDTERAQALEQLSALLGQRIPQGGVSAGQDGQAVGGNVDIRADRGSVAAWSMGNVTLGNPPQPGPPQG